MADTTTHLGLRKPAPSDNVDVVADISDNMDLIDTAVNGKAATGHDHDADYEAAGTTATHEADTTSVHGITDTSVLATAATLATAVSDHSADTTSVHGIADTSVLETTTGADAKVSTHAGLADPHTGYVLESLVDAAADLLVGTAADTVGRLAKGSALDVLRVNAGATALEWAAPSGTPVWTDYVPTWTNLTVGSAVVVARYVQDGKLVHFSVDLIFGAGTSISGQPRFTLPVTAIAGRRVLPAIYNDSGTRIYVGHAWLGVTDANTATLYDAASANGNVTATTPFTWTTSDRINVSGTYEAA